jgi:catechol 2,3-dioxygenase-like lactoylglutathione lyase family enzyme
MDVQLVATIAPIVRDADAARVFYRDALGLFFEGEEGDYVFTQELEGTKHFGLWPLSEAASACFGTTEWPAELHDASHRDGQGRLNARPVGTDREFLVTRTRSVRP